MKICILKPVLSIAALSFSLAAQAQTMSDDDQAAVQLAISRGDKIYAFDQAAWHGTDAMLAAAKKAGRSKGLGAQIGGWIVRPAGENLEVLFFDKSVDAPKVVFSALTSVDGRTVISSAFRDNDAEDVSGDSLRMVKARQAAIRAIQSARPLFCAKASPNTVVLPPERADGPIPVYILTPQTDAKKVPFGGHTRIMVAADGSAGEIHPFTKGCMDLPAKSAKKGLEANVVTQIVDPVPSEISVFTMYASNAPLYVLTMDRRVWSITAPNGRSTVTLVPQNKN